MPSNASLLQRDIATVNTSLTSQPSSALRSLRLEGDCIRITVSASAIFQARSRPLLIALTLAERSAYPNTGGFLYVEEGGTDVAEECIGELASSLGERFRLDSFLRNILEALQVEGAVPCLGTADVDSEALSHERKMTEDRGIGTDEDANSEADEDDEDDDDAEDDSEYDDVLEDQHWVGLQQTKRRWEVAETERSAKRQATGTDVKKKAAVGQEPKPEAPKNAMFSSRESFRMLSNELFSIVKRATEDPSAPIAAEAVADNVHHWKVKLRGFTGDLSDDLTAVKTKHGYDHVDIELIFTPDLHPFYPPQVKIIRPRFKGWILGAVMTHPMFVFSGWDPMRSTQEVLDHVRKLLQDFGRIEIESSTNSASSHPTSAYSELENALIHLEMLSVGLRPHAADRYPELYGNRDKEIDKDRLKVFRNLSVKSASIDSASGTTNHWAKGTGYGHGRNKATDVWDPTASIAAQQYRTGFGCLGGLIGWGDFKLPSRPLFHTSTPRVSPLGACRQLAHKSPAKVRLASQVPRQTNECRDREPAGLFAGAGTGGHAGTGFRARLLPCTFS
jgi:hypothetical protein